MTEYRLRGLKALLLSKPLGSIRLMNRPMTGHGLRNLNALLSNKVHRKSPRKKRRVPQAPIYLFNDHIPGVTLKQRMEVHDLIHDLIKREGIPESELFPDGQLPKRKKGAKTKAKKGKKGK